MKQAYYIIIIILTTGFLSQCKKDSKNNNNSVDCSTVTNKAFAADVNPIIQSVCAVPGCHGTGSTNGVGPLTTYAQISAGATRIRAAILAGTMPQGSSLTTAQKNSIVCWIDSGTPNN